MKIKNKSRKQEYSNRVSPKVFFIILWLATLACFMSTLDPSGTNTGKSISSFLTTLFLGNIVAGIIFFLAIFIKPMYNKIKIADFVKLALTIGLAYFLFYVVSMTTNGIGLVAGMTRVKPIPTLPPIVSLTPTPTISPTPVPTHVYVAPTDSDPIVNCTSSYPSCNGSSIRLHQSQCSQITCCQIGNTWSVYPSSDACKQAQNVGNQQIPPQQNTQQSPGNNTYCWNNAYGYGYYTSSGDQCNADNAKSSAYKICMDTQKIKSNTCDSACQTSSDQAKQACAGLSSYPVDYYGQCLNGPGGVSDQYASCLSKCTDQYSQDIKQCSN